MKLKLVMTSVLLSFSTTALSGELSQKVKDTPEENIFWTQRKASKKIKGVDALVLGSEFEIKPKAIKKLIKAKKEHVAVSVLLSGVKEKLLLVKQDPFAYATDSVHYAGIVKGDAESLVSLSVFDGKLTGSISTNGKKYTISTEGVQVSVLDTSEIKAPEILDTPIELPQTSQMPEMAGIAANTDRPVKVFLVADYKAFLTYNSNKAALTQYLQSVWASVAALYANDGITVQNSGIKVWETQDPYSTLTESNSQSILYNFATKEPLAAGSNLMHLITIRPGMGGVAYLSALCGGFPHGLSSIYSTFTSGAVAYDWTQNVITHEIGHNLSSPHTQACKWNMNGLANQVIDGCYAPEGTCSRPWTTRPTGFKGTIMSYCHLGGYMDLRLGFGDQPKTKIKNYIAQASCLGGTQTDVTSPIVSISSPLANQTVSGVGANRTLSFTANADDDVAVSKVDFILKGPGVNTTLTDMDSPFGVSWDQKDYLGNLSSNGDYTIQAKATDSSGKTALSSIVAFKVSSAALDKTKPAVTTVSPLNGASWTAGPLRFYFTATDNVKVTSMYAYYNNQLLASSSTNSIDRTYDYGVLPVGPCEIKVYAYDADGNYDLKSVNITIGGTADVTKPVVAITGPAQAAQVSGSVSISANASDNIGVSKVDFFAGGVLVLSDTTSPYSANWDSTKVPNGSQQIRAVAYDQAGNFSDASLTVTVNNPVAQGFDIASFTVGQDKTVTDTTKRNWIDLTLTGVVGTPKFQGKALANTSWSTKAGADAVNLGGNVWRIFFFNANTDYQVKAMCQSCSPYAEKIQAFKSLP